jgi:hypothetical protein
MHGSIHDQLRARYPTRAAAVDRGIQAACARKEPLSEDVARTFEARHRPHDPTINAYACWHCHFWHIGHNLREAK